MFAGSGEIAQLTQLVEIIKELVKVTAYLFIGTSIIVVLAFLHHRYVSRIIKGEKKKQQ